MQGDVVAALFTIARAKGWDPAKLDAKPIEVGEHRQLDGDRSLSPFPRSTRQPLHAGEGLKDWDPADQRQLKANERITWQDPLHPREGRTMPQDRLAAATDWQGGGGGSYPIPPIMDAEQRAAVAARRAGVR